MSKNEHYVTCNISQVVDLLRNEHGNNRECHILFNTDKDKHSVEIGYEKPMYARLFHVSKDKMRPIYYFDELYYENFSDLCIKLSETVVSPVTVTDVSGFWPDDFEELL